MNPEVREKSKNQLPTDCRVKSLLQRKLSFVFSVVVLAIICFFASSEALAVNRTWDGEGATNNFNEAANWSGNAVPGIADIAIFDGTSTKNCTINVSVNLSGININAGYVGTITQGTSDVTLSGAYTQAAGTFTGGSGLLDFNGSVTISGGTLTATSITTSFASNLTVSGTGVFNAGTGTVIFDGGGTSIVDVVSPQNFNNLTVNKTGGNSVFISSGATLRVNGVLTLTDGLVHPNGGIPVLEATGNVVFAPTFDGGSINLLISGAATRTVTLPVGVIVPRLTINAPNVTVNTNGAGTITFAQLITIQSAASFTNGAVNFIFSNPFTLNSGANFTPGSGNLTFNSTFIQTGGTFTPGSGLLNFNGSVTISGGTFNAPNGDLNLSSNLTVSGTGVFNAGTGTVIFDGASQTIVDVVSPQNFNNLTVNKTGGNSVFISSGATLRVNGVLTLTDGLVHPNGGIPVLEATGNVVFAPTFDGGSINLLISGAATRTVTLPVGVIVPRLTINAPNVTVNTSGAGTITFAQLITIQSAASFTNGAVNFIFSNPFTLNSGANFTPGSGNLTFNSTFIQTGGTFTPGSGLLNFNGSVTISGGTFNAPNGDLNLSSNLTVSGTGVFNAGTGTVIFDGASQTIVDVVSPQNFNNLTVNKTGGNSVFISSGATLRVNGVLTLTDGLVHPNGGIPVLEATGNVVFAPTFDGGSINLLISGAATRTITLPVGVIVPRLTINAPNVTVNTSGAGTITFAQLITIQSAASFTNGAVNFIFSNPFTLNSGANFTPGSGNLTFNSTFIQTGGTFTPGSGLLNFNGSVTISGGTFNAPNGDLNLSSNLTVSGTGVFNAGTGTVIFDGGGTSIVDVVSPQNFNNLTVNKTGGNSVFISNSATLRVNGVLTLTDGLVHPNGGIPVLEATGNVVFAPTFDGGSINFSFSGASDQTYTNGGGVNTTGTWTVDKSAGTVNLGTDLNLSNGTAGLVLTNGTITTGDFIIIAGSRAITRTNGFVNGKLRRTYTAAGSQTFDVGTSNGYAPATINAVDGTFGATTNFTVASKPGFLDGSDTNKSLSRHWSLAASAGGITAVNIRFDYQDADVPPTANEAQLMFLRRVNGMTNSQNISTLDTTQNFGVLNGYGVITFSEWTLGLMPPTAASVTVGGRVVTNSGRGISRAIATMTDAGGNISYAVTNPFGYYRFADVAAGQSVIISVRHKQYEFANSTRVIFVGEEITSVDFTGSNPVTSRKVRDIGGVITDAKGVKLPNVALELSGGDLKSPVVVMTDESGSYLFSDIPVGAAYVLTVNGKNVTFTPRAIFLTEETAEVNIKAMP